MNYEEATSVRAAYARNESTISELAQQCGLTEDSIRNILSNRSYHDPSFDPKTCGFGNPTVSDLFHEALEMRVERGMSYNKIGQQLAEKYQRVRGGHAGKAWCASSVRAALAKRLEGGEADGE